MRWTNAFLDTLRTQSDPEVDGMVGTFLQERRMPAAQLLAPLIRYDGLPPEDRSPEITEWIANKPSWPEWADPVKVQRGADFFEENGPQIMTCLLMASLPECYAARKGVQVLYLTSQLLSHTRRRLVETAQMVVNAMTPGELDPGGIGYETARRVRLMHAGIRWHIVSDPCILRSGDPFEPRPHYDPAWGVPINQEDLVGTMLTFSIVILDALEKTGERFQREEAEAYHHTWNVVGHLVGVRPDLLPIGLDEGRDLMDKIRGRQHDACREGREMTAAILSFAQRAVRAPWVYGLPASLMRFMVGDKVADILDVPRADWTQLWIGPLVQARRIIDLFGQNRLVRMVTADFNRALIGELLDAERGKASGGFYVPEKLIQSWELDRVLLRV
ncbi:MAG: oxygenase MpaB family protein [Actinomycetota bacterium]